MSTLPIQVPSQILSAGTASRPTTSVASNITDVFGGLLANALSNPPRVPADGPAARQNLAAETPFANSAITSRTGLGKLARLPQLRKQTAESITSFSQQFLALLAEAGIDSSGGFQLQLDELGRIRVLGNPAEREQIEQLLAARPELGDQFREIAAHSSLLKAIETALQFQREYARNPQSAVTKSSHLFSNGRSPKFTLHIRPAGVETSFTEESDEETDDESPKTAVVDSGGGELPISE